MDFGENSNHGEPITSGHIFRRQLYEMVDDPLTDSIVSWGESGKSFIIWDQEKFEKAFILIESLRHVGFTKVESEQWEYACEYFVRGRPEIKPPQDVCGGHPLTPTQLGMIKSVLADRKRIRSGNNHGDSLIPLSSLSCSSELYAHALVGRSPCLGSGAKKGLRPSLFSRKLYEMVDDPSTDSIVSWSESGKSFIVWNESEFLSDVLPRFLSLEYQDMSSFTCWLDILGFSKVETSEHFEYAWDYFVRGQPDLTPPYTPGGLMITPEEGRSIEREFASWKAWKAREQAGN